MYKFVHGGRDNRLSSDLTNTDVRHPQDQATVVADSQQKLYPKSKEGSSNGQEDGEE